MFYRMAIVGLDRLDIISGVFFGEEKKLSFIAVFCSNRRTDISSESTRDVLIFHRSSRIVSHMP